MKIVWKPQITRDVEHLGVYWSFGEVKDIPDDTRVRVNIDGQVQYVTLIDCLLGNPDFKDANTSYNPNYTCSYCGVETRDEATHNIMTGETILLERNGKRVCLQCFREQKLVREPDQVDVEDTIEHEKTSDEPTESNDTYEE